ncbi:hypothetical protein I204_00790 [Kwoniella mangroviensis CBS 8886]|nr:hypothetical protein I204_00790 [Kwoniella mangroviensis CBS 8886]
MASPSTQGGPGPSTTSQKQKRIQATRSHSSPSLTHWIGTPEGGMKRSWIPSTSPGVAITCMEDKKGVGKVDKGKGKDTGVEEGLSQLYVIHEKQELSSTSSTSNTRRRSPIKKFIVIQSNESRTQSQPESGLEPIPDKHGNVIADEVPKAQAQRNSWGSSLMGSVVTAGVFGAALGLTAYRLLANQQPNGTSVSEVLRDADVPMEAEGIENGEAQIPTDEEEQISRSTHQSQDEARISQEEEEAGLGHNGFLASDIDPDVARATASIPDHRIGEPVGNNVDIGQNPISDLPPPPAYEETVQTDSKVKEWEDVEIDDHLVTPSSSKISTLRSKPSSMFLSPSSSPSPKPRRIRHARIRRSRSSRNGWMYNHPLSDSRSLPSIEIYRLTLDDEEIESTFSASPNEIVKTRVKSPGTDETRDNEGDLKLSRDRSDDLNGQKEEGQADDERSSEMISRLDLMSLQLTALIEEGKKALESTPGTGTTPRWEEEGDLLTPSRKNRKNVGVDELRESNIDRSNTHKKTRRGSKIPMRVGSDVHLKHSSSSTRLDTDKGHRKIASSSEVEGSQREVSKSKIPIMSKSRSVVSGLNGV